MLRRYIDCLLTSKGSIGRLLYYNIGTSKSFTALTVLLTISLTSRGVAFMLALAGRS